MSPPPVTSQSLPITSHFQFGFLPSSTSTYSASITSPGFFCSWPPLLDPEPDPEPDEDPPPPPLPAAAPAACCVLYSSSATLCIARSTFSVAERSRAVPPSDIAFFASSRASSTFLTSASGNLSRFSRIVFSAWKTMPSNRLRDSTSSNRRRSSSECDSASVRIFSASSLVRPLDAVIVIFCSLNVSAKDKATNKEQKITITASSVLTKEEAEKMRTEAESHSEDDRRRFEEVESRNRLDGTIFHAEKTIRENREKLPEADVKKAEEALEDAKKAMSEGGTARLRSATENVERAMHKIAEELYKTSPASAGQAGAASAGDRKSVV